MKLIAVALASAAVLVLADTAQAQNARVDNPELERGAGTALQPVAPNGSYYGYGPYYGYGISTTGQGGRQTYDGTANEGNEPPARATIEEGRGNSHQQ